MHRPRCCAARSAQPSSSGRDSSGRVERAGRGQVVDEPAVHRQHLGGLVAGVAQLHVALDVVPQHRRGHVVGHLDEQGVALLVGEVALGDHPVEQDLDVDLVVAGVHAGGVVDGVGVEPHAVLGGLDPAPLGEAEVAALADDAGAQVAPVDAQAVVGLVADLGVGLGGGLDVGADAAVPQQVHRRGERGADQLGRGEDGLRRPGPSAAAARRAG